MNRQFLEKYARLIVTVGVNIRKGDRLFISASVHGAALAACVTEAAYQAGAQRVTVTYNDETVARAHYRYMTEADLIDFPQWQIIQREKMVEERSCYVSILSEDPDAFADIDAGLLARYSAASHRAFKSYYDAATSNAIRWCLCAVPNPAWARKIYPQSGMAEAQERLWQAIAQAMRLDREDPQAAWQAHIRDLQARCDFLNGARFSELIYRSANGTDLRIGLPEGYYFSGGHEIGREGIPFTANMPTEEVFSAPNRLTAEGRLVSSMPLVHNGGTVDEFFLEFREGRIVDYGARRGADILRSIIETDEGSHYLGEVALVQYDSPVRNLDTLFYNTLFDENAACHFAIGEAYPMIENAERMTEAQLLAAGLNKSCTHVDFMIGTADLSVDGLDGDGNAIPVFRGGNFCGAASGGKGL